MDLSSAVWRKASRSSDNGGQCVEVALNLPGVVAVRDSKDPDGPKLLFTRPEWKAFLNGLKTGDFEIAEGLTRRDGSGPVSSVRPEAAA